MNARRAYITSTIFAALGIALSGTLSYRSYFGAGCGATKSFFTCGTVTIFNQPTCIYGFAVFVLALLVALFGLSRAASDVRPLRWLVWIGLAGVLFAGVLSVYELGFLGFTLGSLPVCVYGFFFFLGIFVSALVAVRRSVQLPTA